MKYPIPELALKESVAIIGRTGSGKTYAAKGAVERLLDDGARICIIDPTGVWWGLRSSADGEKPAFPVIVFGGDHADVKIADTSGAALAQLLAGQNLPSIIDLSEFTMGARVRFMTPFLDELYRGNRTPITLIVDEADLFAPQRALPDQTVMLSRMEQIVRRGRVRGFRPWLITQRPAELHKSVLSQANTLIAMQLTAPQDRDAVGAWIEGQADRDEGKKVLADLPRLKKGEGWVWSPSHDVLERVRFPAIKTFDSSQTPEDGQQLPAVELATINLSAVSESLRAVETEIAANDPRALKARIADLERQIAARGPQIDPAALSEAEERGYRRGMQRAQLDFDSVRTHIMQARSILENAQAMTEIERVPTSPAARSPAPAPAERRAPAVQRGPGDAMPKAERLILTALAQYPQGRKKAQVAILTGYAVNGGAFNNSLGALRSKGYITRGEPIQTMEAGLRALGDYEPLPHGRALLEHWLSNLGKAEKLVLQALADAYPRTLTKQQVANAAGYEASGGAFNNALGRLRTLELIRGRGDIRASEELFS